jgi:hypothetical protein
MQTSIAIHFLLITLVVYLYDNIKWPSPYLTFSLAAASNE